MTQQPGLTGWSAVARETFEYNLIPWLGRQYAPWLRAATRAHPVDPSGQVLVPERVYRVFTQEHRPFERVTPRQLAAMGYPRLPDEDRLEHLERAVQQALARGEPQRVPALWAELYPLQERVLATREALRNGRAPAPVPAPATPGTVTQPALPRGGQQQSPIFGPAVPVAA